MNNEQWQSLIRTVLAVALGPGSYVVSRGVLSADQANELAPVLVPVVMAVGGIIIGKWSVSAHSPTAVAAAVAGNPAVASAVINTMNTAAVPGVKVVADTSSSPPAVAMTKTGKVISAHDRV